MALSKTEFIAHVNAITAVFLNALQDEIIDNCVTTAQVKTFGNTAKANGRAQIGAASAEDMLNRTSYTTCSTGAGTAAKTADLSGFSNSNLVAGATVKVKFANTNTAAAPTLKIGSADAKAIMMYGTTPAGTNPSTSWNAGEVVELVYDGANWLMVKNFAITYTVVSTL